MYVLVSVILSLSFISAILPAAALAADQSEVIDRLKAGGHILMIRHALAPGNGDPPNFEIGDCATQRNLDDTGRDQARSIGEWLRNNGVTSSRVYSSQWCRCIETARLLNLGPVQELAALNSYYERVQDREPNLRALNDFISQQPTKGELIILVTHFVTIADIAGTGVSSGGGALLGLHADAPYTVVGRLDFGQ
ncbi:MAG: histidine phosphatase family protein [Desulfobacterales bacterium]